MKINALATSLAVVVVILLLGYGIFMTFGSKSEVAGQLVQITPAAEKEDINVNILSDPQLQKVQSFRAYGQHPIVVDPKTINRPDPFAGI